MALLGRKCQNYVLQAPITLLGRVTYIKPSKCCVFVSGTEMTASPVLTASALVHAKVCHSEIKYCLPHLFVAACKNGNGTAQLQKGRAKNKVF